MLSLSWVFESLERWFRPDVPAPPEPASPHVPAEEWEAPLDSLFWAGYLRAGDAGALGASLARLQEAEAAAAQGTGDAQVRLLEAQIEAQAEAQRTLPGALRGVRRSLRRVERRRLGAGRRVDRAREALVVAYAELLADRPEHPLRLAAARVDAEAALAERVGTAGAALDRVRFESDVRRMVATAVTAPEEPGRPTRLDVLEAEVAERQARHDACVLRAERAIEAGLSRRASGFLRWGGQLGLAVLGWYLGDALLTRVTGGDGVMGFIANESYRVFRDVGPVRGFLWVLALGVLLLAGGTLVVLAFDRVVARFDRAWNPPPPPEEKARRGRRAAPVPEAEGPARVDLSWNSVLEPFVGDVERAHYRSHLARTPLLVLPALGGLLLLLFLSLGGGIGAQVELPVDSLLYTFVGICIAVAAAGLVFVALGTPLTAPLRGEPMPRGWIAAAAVPWVLGLWSAAAEAAGAGPGPWVEGGVTGPLLLVLANAVVMAAGHAYHAVHADAAAARRDLHRARRALAAALDEPAERARRAEELSLVERWEELQETLAGAWQEQDRDDAVRLAGGPGAPGEPAGGYRDPLLAATVVTARDARLAPGPAGAVVAARARYLSARRHARRLARRAGELRARLEELKAADPAARMAQLAEALHGVRLDTLTAVARVDTRYAALRLEAEAALRTGEALAQREAALRAPALRSPAPWEAA